MYTLASTQPLITCSEKMVLKLGFVLMALAVFSGQVLPDAEYSGGGNLKGFVQENVMSKELSNNALFLLKKNWRDELNTKYGRNNVSYLDDGVAYISIVRYINSRRTKINIAEINRNLNPDIEIVPQLSSYKMHSKSKINSIADEDVLVAVNGTYFKQDTGTPLGALVINNRIISGPIYERAALGITKDGFKTARVSFSGVLSNGTKTINIDNINQPRMMASNVLVYTAKWGSKSPATSKPSYHISIRNGVILEKSDKPLSIPFDGHVVCAPKEKLEGFETGDEVEISYALSPNWNDAVSIISGGPYLMKDGKIYTDTSAEKLNAVSGRNPRTAVGYREDNTMIMITVDGRKEGSSGVTIEELAQLMKQLGCYEAINLDGGSSTVMYVDGKTYSGSNLRNSVSINNALIVRNKIS